MEKEESFVILIFPNNPTGFGVSQNSLHQPKISSELITNYKKLTQNY